MALKCEIEAVGKRRDGKLRYWCLAHRANATAFGGVPMERCERAHAKALDAKDILELHPEKYGGGIALWGAVPAVYTTAAHDLDELGVHVHARRKPRKKKLIDQTFKLVSAHVVGADATKRAISVTADDAIAYMVSSIFGHALKYVECTYCGVPHLDKDWFSVHLHRSHLCFACGRTFRDSEPGIANPLIALKTFCGDAQINRRTVPADRALEVNQDEFPLGIELWGSHEAILWTPSASEESGIHFHGYTSNFVVPTIDETYDTLRIDGILLDNEQMRVLMAQMVLPHLKGRIVSLHCSRCEAPHFDTGKLAYTPHTVHACSCGAEFSHTGRVKNVVSNPMLATLAQIEKKSVRKRRSVLDWMRPASDCE